MDEQNRNLLMATALSFLVLFVWMMFFQPPPPDRTQQPQQPVTAQGDVTAPRAEGQAATPTLSGVPVETRAAALAKTERVAIETPRLAGSLSLIGGRLDDLKLKDYNVEVGDASQKVTLLSPAGGPNAYYALYGWAPAAGLSFDDVPGATTPWTVESGGTLGIGAPVTLVWDNGKGLIFRRTVEVDENFMFTMTQSVENTTAEDLRMQPYGIVARVGTPEISGFFISHEGLLRTQDGVTAEIDYDDLVDGEIDPTEGGVADKATVAENGWLGFGDKYWLTALIPEAGTGFTGVAKYTAGNDTFQTDMRLPTMTVAAGETTTVATRLFAGAKEWETLRDYQDSFGIDRFIYAIDWGILYFLTIPIFWVLHELNIIVGNMGWSIIGLTLIIKALLLPLAYKSYVSMARMKELQPEMEKVKERVGDDRQKLQQEMMQLYRDKKVNPAAGCLPILPQIPIFFALYKVIFVTIELRHAPFIWWLQDLSVPDPTSILNLFGLLPWGTPPDTSLFFIFSIGVFPVLMGVTMWLQQKLNPAPTDKTQATIFAWMPWVFMFMLGTFASGLVVYWVANNTITFIQQYIIMRSQGVKPNVFGNIIDGFKRMRSAEK
ncbi:MAG: membrane protein insertase YidC [Pseudomonadota bacterium]